MYNIILIAFVVIAWFESVIADDGDEAMAAAAGASVLVIGLLYFCLPAIIFICICVCICRCCCGSTQHNVTIQNQYP